MKYYFFSLLIPLVCGLKAGTLDQRVTVVEYKDAYFGFLTNGGQLYSTTSPDSKQWGQWVIVNTSTGSYPPMISNPVSTIDEHTGVIVVYVQASDGQAYGFFLESQNTFKVTKISSSIPCTKSRDEFSLDGIKFIKLHNRTHLFVRSQINRSRIHYGYQEWSKGVWSSFDGIADDDNHLKYDFDVAVNEFVERIEIFAVVGDGKVKHTWQTSYTSFQDNWHEIVDLFSPKFDSAPAVHKMGHSVFNGMLELFVREGKSLHRIHQTTCDKVKNIWGPCTWDVRYHQLGGDMPSDPKSPNPLSVSNNIHKGQEVFVVGVNDGHLYHIWQPERGEDWTDWEDLGLFPSGEKFQSIPFILIDHHGWWEAYGLTTSVLNKYVQIPLIFSLTPQRVAFYQNVTVTWQIPIDEATHQDWIGVYPHGAENHKYVDFVYVGGTQNPKSDPVPKGSLKLTALLPDGQYDYRYLVNKEYDNVLEGSVEIYNATKDQDWVQVYKGIARGLGNLRTNLTACVKDGNHTIDVFKESFTAFEDRAVVKGLHLFAEALKDVAETLIQCEETDIAKKLEKFITDLISCTESNCDKFAIDIGIELLIIYERFYEIYGDILASKNNFDIHAYEMGGVCVGRVTWACLALPSTTHV